MEKKRGHQLNSFYTRVSFRNLFVIENVTVFSSISTIHSVIFLLYYIIIELLYHIQMMMIHKEDKNLQRTYLNDTNKSNSFNIKMRMRHLRYVFLMIVTFK